MSTKTLCTVLRNMLCLKNKNLLLELVDASQIILPDKRNAEAQALCWAVVLNGKIKLFKTLVTAILDVSLSHLYNLFW